MMRNHFLNLAMLVGCLLAGLIVGPHVNAIYQRIFPEPAFVVGDFGALYRETGKTVVMFSTSTCPHCRNAREFLTREHVDYQDFVIDQSADAQQRFARLDGAGVPMLFIGDRRIVGFDETAIRDSLARVSIPLPQ